MKKCESDHRYGLTNCWVKKIRDILVGGDAMRCPEYLRKHYSESDQNYDDRRRIAVFDNYFERALDSSVSKPFADPPKFSKDVPFLYDVDRKGSRASVFLRQVYREAYAFGTAYVWINIPTISSGTTEAEVYSGKYDPYWSIIPPENVVVLERGHGGDVSRVVFETCDYVNEYVISPQGIINIYTDEKGRQETLTSLKFIPLQLVELGAKVYREGCEVVKPNLLDLADMNILHFNMLSDHCNAVAVSSFPMLAATGVADADSPIQIGPRVMLASSSPETKYFYVEHSGAALGVGAAALLDLEARMERYGAEQLRVRPGTETATAAAIDSSEARSIIEASCLAFEDSVDNLLVKTSEFYPALYNTEFKLNRNFSVSSQGDGQALVELYRLGAISREAVLNEFKRSGVLDAGFDPEADKEKLDSAVNPVGFGNGA